MKTIRFHHVLLFVILVIVVLLNASIENVWTKRNYEFFPDMASSVPVDAQTARWNAFMRPRGSNPAAGTQAAFQTAAPSVLPSAALAPADSAAMAWTTAAMPRGKEVYDIFCLPCHGGSGAGDGEIATRGYPPPPSLLAENALKLGDQEIFRIVSEGRGNMPSYRSQILSRDIWKSILYIRSMQSAAKPAADTVSFGNAPSAGNPQAAGGAQP